MKRELDLLYEIIPYDSLVRKNKLKNLVKSSAVDMQIVLSIGELFNFKNIKLQHTTQFHNNKDILNILARLIRQDTKSLFEKILWLLDYKHQIVIKNLIDKKVYDNKTILYNVDKLYTKSELLELLPLSLNGIPYIIANNKLESTYRSPNRVLSTIKDRSKLPTVPVGFTYITDGKFTVIKGDKSLYEYFTGKRSDFFMTTELPTFIESDEFEKIKEVNKGKYIYTFNDTLDYMYELPNQVTVRPIDYLISDDFEAIGYVFKIEDNLYKSKCKVSKRAIDRGLENVELVVDYKLKNGKIVSTRIVNTIDLTKSNKDTT